MRLSHHHLGAERAPRRTDRTSRSAFSPVEDMTSAGADEMIQIKCLQGWKGHLTLSKHGRLEDLMSKLAAAASADSLCAADVLSLIVRGKRIDPAVESNRASLLSDLGIVHNAAVMIVVRSAQERAVGDQ